MDPSSPDASEREKAYKALREDLDTVFEDAIEQHEAKMTKLGFVFLAVFIGVIAIAALLP